MVKNDSRQLLRRSVGVACLLELLVVSSSLRAQIVDIDGRENGKSNPVVLSFSPGAYYIKPINKAAGGKYEGFLLSSSNPTSYSYGYAVTSAEFPIKVFWDNKMYATAAAAYANAVPGSFSLARAGEVRFHIHDDFPGDNVGGVSLLVTRDGTSPSLSFARPTQVSCDATILQYTTSVLLTTGEDSCERPGPRGWSLAVASQGCSIVSATTRGTAGDLPPMGQRLDGFERTELTSGADNEGAVSVVSLSIDGASALPACSSFELLKLTLEAPSPASDNCAPASIKFIDRNGSEGVVSNLLDIEGESVQPLLQTMSFDLCKCTSRVSLLALEPGAVQVVLDHELPVTGGELGIAYDPGRMVPIEVLAGADFPGTPSNIFSSLRAPVNCSQGGEAAAVEAGLVIGWINEGTGAVLPPGVHALFEIRFAVSEEEEGGLCSRLRFVECLGAAAAPVQNSVSDLEDRPVKVLTADGSVCSGLEVFERGDVNGDHRYDISDAISNLRCLFGGENCASCPDASDANDDGLVDISDSIYLLRWRFMEGLPPPSPFGHCGIDRSPDALGACSQPACCDPGFADCVAAP